MLKIPHCIAALGLMHLTKLQVDPSSIWLRSFMDAKKLFATVGFTND